MQQWYRCPYCGNNVAYGQPGCSSCGNRLQWQQQPQLPPQQPVQPSQYQSLPQYQQQYQQPGQATQQSQQEQLYSRSFELGVAGESFDNDDGSSRQEILRRCTLGEPIYLIHQPHPQDKNAVKVCRANGEQIGWIRKEQSSEFANILKRGDPVDAEISKLLGGYPINCVLKITKYSNKPFTQTQYQQIQQEPKKPNSKTWKIVLGVLGGLILLGSCGICLNSTSKTSTPGATAPGAPSTTSAPTPKQVDDSIKAGMYKVGKDIQAGEYVLFASGGLTSYFQVAKDSSGTLDSIITNDNFNGNRYITVVDAQYIEFSRAKMFPVNKAPVLQPIDGKYPEGMYKVGRDIIAGEYKVVSDGGSSYLEVAADSSGLLDSIITNDNFATEKYITIKDGQYIKLSHCHIVK